MIIVKLQFDPAFWTGILLTLNVIGRSFAYAGSSLHTLYLALLSLLLLLLPCTLFLALLFLLRLRGFGAFAQGYLR
jgi:hypothetical protein